MSTDKVSSVKVLLIRRLQLLLFCAEITRMSLDAGEGRVVARPITSTRNKRMLADAMAGTRFEE